MQTISPLAALLFALSFQLSFFQRHVTRELQICFTNRRIILQSVRCQINSKIVNGWYSLKSWCSPFHSASVLWPDLHTLKGAPSFNEILNCLLKFRTPKAVQNRVNGWVKITQHKKEGMQFRMLCDIDSTFPTQIARDAQKWVRQPTDHERENDQKRCPGCTNVPLL